MHRPAFLTDMFLICGAFLPQMIMLVLRIAIRITIGQLPTSSMMASMAREQATKMVQNCSTHITAPHLYAGLLGVTLVPHPCHLSCAQKLGLLKTVDQEELERVTKADFEAYAPPVLDFCFMARVYALWSGC